MRRIIVIALFLSLIMASPLLAKDKGTGFLQLSSVKIVTRFVEKSGRIWICSGVVIGGTDTQSYILTAKHCMEEDNCQFGGGWADNSYITKVFLDKKADLAFLIVEPKLRRKTPIRIAKKVSWMEEIRYLGYPSGLFYYKEGKIIILQLDGFLVNFEAINGCSGGGIFNENNELVGIITRKTQTKSFGIPANRIKDFLDRTIKKIENSSSGEKK